MWTTFIWYIFKFYTWTTMMFNKYINYKQDKKEYPFSIVSKNGLSKIYYPELESTSYSFVQNTIEMEDGDQYDLHLREFFVVGNQLFKHDFLEYYLFENYNFILKENMNYKINIIDHDINILTVNKNEYIELFKDNYLKKSLEE
jgi:hypothetical protein